MEKFEFESLLNKVLDYYAEKLKFKNKNYGNSALNPPNIFSKSDAEEQLKVSIDHKLSRIKNKGIDGDEKEDSLDDLIGYLILLKIELLQQKEPTENETVAFIR